MSRAEYSRKTIRESFLTYSLMIITISLKGVDIMRQINDCKKVKLQVIVSEELANKVDAIARESGMSRSALCTILIADGVRNRQSSDEFFKALPESIAKIFTNPDAVKAIKDNAPSV